MGDRILILVAEGGALLSNVSMEYRRATKGFSFTVGGALGDLLLLGIALITMVVFTVIKR